MAGTLSFDSFDEFFKKAIDKKPYPYQSRLATESQLPQLIDIPTGAGKTAAVILAWLWRRRFAADEVRMATPRRLVYCLPMRVLVEQTRDSAILWLHRLNLLGGKATLEGKGNDERVKAYAPSWEDSDKITVTVLMGGEGGDEWDIYPERDAIIIGTQDMLLSRALNRGYGMSRYRWPMHFGLLNNDCLWVMDEVQLMGAGLATSVQLHLFHERLWKSAIPCYFLWMSATPGEGMFATRDRNDAKMGRLPHDSILQLSRNERNALPALMAEKKVELLDGEPKISSPRTRDGILDKHRTGDLTLVVANTVSRAQEWFNGIKDAIERKNKRKEKRWPEVVLLHGRMRPCDRKRYMDTVLAFVKGQGENGRVPDHPGLIVVATQVVEAGLDVSAGRLWSEVAPWPSVIQRLGRLNRQGKQIGASGWFWFPKSDLKVENVGDAPNAGRIGPYEKNALSTSNELLKPLLLKARQLPDTPYRDALDAILKGEESGNALRISHNAVIRSKDIHELFSTEPDLAGGFTDVSRYVRNDDQDPDVQVFWADFKKQPSPELSPSREILCRVPVFVLDTFLRTNKSVAWEWDLETGEYQKVKSGDVCSGMTLLLPQSSGGYDEQVGWTGSPNHKPATGLAEKHASERFSDDSQSEGSWQSLVNHLLDTEKHARELVDQFNLPDPHKQAVISAARWHDIGKSHFRWQDAIKTLHRHLLKASLAAKLPLDVETLLRQETFPEPPQAKFPSWHKQIERIVKDKGGERSASLKMPKVRFDPGLRHEAVSALAAWQQWLRKEDDMTALAVYLVAAHHGKVRTVLRSTKSRGDVFGVMPNDKIPPLPGWINQEETLDLRPKVFGLPGRWVNEETYEVAMPSWVGITSELLGDEVGGYISEEEPKGLGPFSLSFLELMVVAADRRASRQLGEKGSAK